MERMNGLNKIVAASFVSALVGGGGGFIATWVATAGNLATKQDLKETASREQQFILDYIKRDSEDDRLMMDKLILLQENVARIGVKIDVALSRDGGAR